MKKTSNDRLLSQACAVTFTASAVVEALLAALLWQHPEHTAGIFDRVLLLPRDHNVPRPVRIGHNQGRCTDFWPYRESEESLVAMARLGGPWGCVKDEGYPRLRLGSRHAAL